MKSIVELIADIPTLTARASAVTSRRRRFEPQTGFGPDRKPPGRASFLPCAQKPLPAPLKPIRAGLGRFRADENQSVRPFSRPCGQNSIRAGHCRFVREVISPVRAKIHLCGQNPFRTGFFQE
jgi:hypothetical protein